MIFYAPARGLREVRDRAPLAPVALLALVSHVSLFWSSSLYSCRAIVAIQHPFSVLVVIFQSAGCLLFLALIFVPLAILLLNLGERRASYRLFCNRNMAPPRQRFSTPGRRRA